MLLKLDKFVMQFSKSQNTNSGGFDVTFQFKDKVGLGLGEQRVGVV